MSIVAYVYDNTGQNQLGQIYDIFSFSSKDALDDISTAQMAIDNLKLENISSLLQMNNRIVINNEVGGSVQHVITGYICGFEDDEQHTTLYINDLLGIFDDKILRGDRTYTSQTVKHIIEDIVNNNVNNNYDTHLTVDCDVLDVVPLAEYKDNDIIYNIIRDLVKDKYECKVIGSVLTLKSTIGIDRSIAGDDYVEFVFDRENPLLNTIQSFSQRQDIKEMANYVRVKQGNLTVEDDDATSISTYGSIERSMTTDSNKVAVAADAIAQRKDPQKEISITPSDDENGKVGLGDMVQVYIDNGNDRAFFDGSLKVVEKVCTLGETITFSYKLSANKVRVSDFMDKFNKGQELIRKIALRF